ncbi:HPr family phosphocarrier protein [Opitutales bacterium ASA1]|uniref:HPr family phosphocarrier protein n=1 Tax=Congregicoccus parvus TaxID=3081749 RepID=UPI002B2EBCAD|nr:HPr family phosphocarrier protein [Opitutales bacterium ASA1]
MEATTNSPAGDTIDRVLTVQNKMGIHARPAAMIVRVTTKFAGEVYFEKDDEQVNGKSIMGLMMLAAGRGSQIRVTVKGAGASQLVNDLEALFARKFDEG